MRRYSGDNKKPSVTKIIILAAAATILFATVLDYFNIGHLLIRGPKTIVQLVTDTGLKSTNGRVNILLLGIGGEGHDGPNLSDTMILASIDKSAKDAVLVSIPRDLWAPSISSKINAAYAFGQEKDQGGLELSKKTLSLLFGIPIHYAVRVDFSGFEKAVDLVGGLDTTVEIPFVDPQYPLEGKEDDLCGLKIETQDINGVQTEVVKTASGSAIILSQITDQENPFTCRYEALTFKQGPLHLDGKTALKFVRSRHGTNDEGSDFARSTRQQKVILAFRQKVISTSTLTNPTTIINLAKTFNRSIDTDIADDDIPLLVKLGQKIDPQTIRRVTLDAGRNTSVLDVGDPTNYNGQYVLDPKTDNWGDLADYVQGEIFKLEEEKVQD
ncbi:hypothetical protein A2870_02700 [Candidatus Curtissbacteria bacterium RIFCSPHIGHO2_01_FULL_41_11]|uniref:Cell envelope-related transcriptional attenuator domain-containing protein n=1 Tax=Candidatus Curtissbacteria bacterium RIFCSPHIGHO2_01_FULL_41_11 TaxID=1797711 RepID=A0A1F5G4C4_9BACT|nr:MAG: hypothetical protein A2870_02700 [Candidatus Curtissbacteria bacterium RIFCSPHIGHO2_01_FULL_41_11]